MLPLSTELASRTLIQKLPETTKKEPAQSDAIKPAAEESNPAVSVTISGAAMKAAAAEKTSNSDIDDSGLSDTVKNLLKMIREIKKQIAEKQAEMAAVMADRSLSPEQAQAKAASLQSALAGLQSALGTAQASLSKAMKDMSAETAAKTASLAMK
ncbi:hypothetical protein K0P33_23630 [Pseudomonas sp. ArH3a]|nr:MULTISPECIES: hypothetical protein [unclassified Pseudomonas]MCV2226432.1 hypothetical protein [Pseudomonas sp. AU10]OZO05586.1 hypothetical protein B7453_05535 [Pseudomonas sp. IB20]UNM22916.1 hypothetical protein K0P33_23630 [Pseudomonas sp. ArH3a]